MFWTDWGKNPRIEKAHLTGNSRQTIVNSNLKWPNDIALDHQQKLIYWVDSNNLIECSDYSGGGRRKLFHHNVIRPFGVAILNSFLYWTDWNSKSGLHKMSITSGKLISKLYIPVKNNRMGLATLDSSRQPASKYDQLAVSLNNRK